MCCRCCRWMVRGCVYEADLICVNCNISYEWGTQRAGARELPVAALIRDRGHHLAYCESLSLTVAHPPPRPSNHLLKSIFHQDWWIVFDKLSPSQCLFIGPFSSSYIQKKNPNDSKSLHSLSPPPPPSHTLPPSPLVFRPVPLYTYIPFCLSPVYLILT